MKILLLIDTTLGGIALGLASLPDLDKDHSSPLNFLGYEFRENGATTCIAETLNQALKNNNLTINDIHTIGVSVGPGSFTGIKIGVAFAEGLVTGSMQRIRLIEVSSLVCLGEKFAADGKNLWFLSGTSEQGFLTMPVEEQQCLFVCKVEGEGLALYDVNSKRIYAAEISLAASKRVDIIGACPKIESRFVNSGVAIACHKGSEMLNFSMSAMVDAVYRRWLKNLFVESLTPLYLRKSTPEEKLAT